MSLPRVHLLNYSMNLIHFYSVRDKLDVIDVEADSIDVEVRFILSFIFTNIFLLT